MKKLINNFLKKSVVEKILSLGCLFSILLSLIFLAVDNWHAAIFCQIEAVLFLIFWNDENKRKGD